MLKGILLFLVAAGMTILLSGCGHWGGCDGYNHSSSHNNHSSHSHYQGCGHSGY